MATYPKGEPSAALQARRAAVEVEAATLVAPASAPSLAAARQRLAQEQQALEAAEAAYALEHSFIGRLGHTIEPVMRPLGFDWKLSAGILSAFAAREVIISVLGTIYTVEDADEHSLALRDHLRADRDPETGAPVYTPLVALSLLVFFVLALQCTSTLAVARRELNSWRWPAFMWVYMTALAYLAALLVYQGGKALGWG
jgi:ferrous iron transport protein B